LLFFLLLFFISSAGERRKSTTNTAGSNASVCFQSFYFHPIQMSYTFILYILFYGFVNTNYFTKNGEPVIKKNFLNRLSNFNLFFQQVLVAEKILPVLIGICNHSGFKISIIIKD